jgi:hypothetical protein
VIQPGAPEAKSPLFLHLDEGRRGGGEATHYVNATSVFPVAL